MWRGKARDKNGLVLLTLRGLLDELDCILKNYLIGASRYSSRQQWATVILSHMCESTRDLDAKPLTTIASGRDVPTTCRLLWH